MGRPSAWGPSRPWGTARILEKYREKHSGSLAKYGDLAGEVVFRVLPERVKTWEYVNGERLRREIQIPERRALELDVM